MRGDLGVEQGTYRVRDVQRGVDVEYGEYLNVWRRTNGQWRAYRSMYNITMAQKGGISVDPGRRNSRRNRRGLTAAEQAAKATPFAAGAEGIVRKRAAGDFCQ